jgi:hypothetical protein
MSEFDYIKFDFDAHTMQLRFKFMFQSIKQEVDKLPPGRAKDLVCIKLEEAYMWVGKAIRDEQIERERIREMANK